MVPDRGARPPGNDEGIAAVEGWPVQELARSPGCTAPEEPRAVGARRRTHGARRAPADRGPEPRGFFDSAARRPAYHMARPLDDARRDRRAPAAARSGVERARFPRLVGGAEAVPPSSAPARRAAHFRSG